MTEKERKIAMDNLMDKITAPGAKFVIKDGNDERFVDTDMISRTMAQFSRVEDAFTFLYAYLHLEDLIDPELGIMNASPKQWDSEHILPRDTFNPEMQEKMSKMELREFVRTGKRLVAQGLPLISVTADYDDIRVNCQLFTGLSFRAAYDNQFTLFMNAFSADKDENDCVLAQIEYGIAKWYKENGLI